FMEDCSSLIVTLHNPWSTVNIPCKPAVCTSEKFNNNLAIEFKILSTIFGYCSTRRSTEHVIEGFNDEDDNE
ncbi:MAG: hypothetical protein ACO1OT_10350, partial [Heyndrickxia sp.]